MKKILSLFAVLAFMSMGQSAFAWTFDGLGSLNPFTNFGRGFRDKDCGCVKQKVSKCDRIQMRYGAPTGYAAPVIIHRQYAHPMPVIIDETPNYSKNLYIMPCNGCRKAF